MVREGAGANSGGAPFSPRATERYPRATVWADAGAFIENPPSGTFT